MNTAADDAARKKLAEEAIDLLVDAEIAAGNKKHGPFHSCHEGYAAIKEEIEEAQDEMDRITASFSELWYCVKHDRYGKDNGVLRYPNTIEDAAICMAAEAIQIAAMARKFTAFVDAMKAGDVSNG